jgi:hypothetical protein
MKIKDACFAVVAAGLILMFAYFVFRRQDNDPIRYDNYENIQIGMSREEVKELLGCGPCTHENGSTWITICSYKGPDPREYWRGGRKAIHISFVDDRVAGKSIEDREIPARSWIEGFRRWFGLRGPADNTWATVGE